MSHAPLIVREEPPEFYPVSIVPFRTQMAATHPATNNVIRIETAEVWWTCPEGWHRSPVVHAMPNEEFP